LSCTDNIIVLFILLFTEVCLFVVEYVCIFAIRDKYAKFLIVASLMFFSAHYEKMIIYFS